MLREHLVDQIVGRVLDHLDLFEDDALLLRDFARRERRPHQHVAEQIDRRRQVLVEDFDVVARIFLRGEGVELAADRVDRLRDLLRRPRRRALEEHVFDEVRDAAFLVRLVPRAARQPQSDRHRSDVRHRLGDQPQARRQRLGSHHGALVLPAIPSADPAVTAKLFIGLNLSTDAASGMIP